MKLSTLDKEANNEIKKSTLFASLLLSTSAFAQQFAATGVHAGFGVNSINPIATFENVSKFMESEDFKKQGITAALV